VTFKGTVTKANQRAVCLALHSTYSQLSAEFEGRQYGSGVLKLEPSEAKRLRVPASPEILAALAKEWTNLAKKAHCVGWEKVVGEIDQIIVSNSKELSKTLPPEHATRILEKVRNRRNGLVSVGVGGL
jgi:hypothetical protein